MLKSKWINPACMNIGVINLSHIRMFSAGWGHVDLKHVERRRTGTIDSDPSHETRRKSTTARSYIAMWVDSRYCLGNSVVVSRGWKVRYACTQANERRYVSVRIVMAQACSLRTAEATLVSISILNKTFRRTHFERKRTSLLLKIVHEFVDHDTNHDSRKPIDDKRSSLPRYPSPLVFYLLFEGIS